MKAQTSGAGPLDSKCNYRYLKNAVTLKSWPAGGPGRIDALGSLVVCQFYSLVEPARSQRVGNPGWQTHPILGACMHSKSLQSCLTLCDPMDCSSPVGHLPQKRQVWKMWEGEQTKKNLALQIAFFSPDQQKTWKFLLMMSRSLLLARTQPCCL